MSRALAVLTMIMLLFVLWTETVAAPAIAAGNTAPSRNGLTCDVSWNGTWGSASCRGISTQRWRLHASCAWQADYTGGWHSGPGSDWAECTFSIQSATIEWG